MSKTISFSVDGAEVSVADDGASLLEVLRDRLGARSPKDGCSPQGQCGCCTVLVDGAPRVSCVTPTRRVAGRSVTTLDGLDPDEVSVWTGAFMRSGASQCGFCTPGIIVRLAGLLAKRPEAGDAEIATALSAHLCRCTGWRTITEAVHVVQDRGGSEPERDLEKAAVRAEIEGRTPQRVGRDVAAGRGGFADDIAPPGSLVAVADSSGGWSVAETVTAAREASGKVQGRNSGARPAWPLEVPEGSWDLELRTTFVEPAYLEPDASWCEPGGVPVSPVANGGAFGAKLHSVVTNAARDLADAHGRPVRVLLSREDVVRKGPKRPPIAAGVRSDGTGVVRVGWTPGSEDPVWWIESFGSRLPECRVEVVEIAGPPVSSDVRGAGWVEAAVLSAVIGSGSRDPRGVGVYAPEGGWASVSVDGETVRVLVDAGDPLDEVVLRSYCTGAVHQALGWVRREAIAVDAGGNVLDLTIRSFGVLPAREMPVVEVEIVQSDAEAVNASDAVFAATAAAAWLECGLAPEWPVEVSTRGERGEA